MPHKTNKHNQAILTQTTILNTLHKNTLLIQLYRYIITQKKSNNPFYIKTLSTQLKIQTPKTFWSEKNKTTTLLFKTQTELNTFRSQIQENTFGVYAKYTRPSTLNTEPTQRQVARMANVSWHRYQRHWVGTHRAKRWHLQSYENPE